MGGGRFHMSDLAAPSDLLSQCPVDLDFHRRGCAAKFCKNAVVNLRCLSARAKPSPLASQRRAPGKDAKGPLQLDGNMGRRT